MITTIKPGAEISFWYTNHRGERALRNAVFNGVEFGLNEWHQAPTIFLRCWADDRAGVRSFDVAKIEDLQLGYREAPA